MRIFILDSGVNREHPRLRDLTIGGYGLLYEEGSGRCRKIEDIEDRIGHGTAIYDIISSNCPGDAEIVMIKIFWESMEISEAALCAILSWLYEQAEIDILNLSFGLTYCDNLIPLYNLCKKFYEKGTLLFSAFDNAGMVSWPAAFDCVYGVMGTEKIRNFRDIAFVQQSYVNILAKGTVSKLAWTEPAYVFSSANSFSCAIATARIAKLLLEKRLEVKEIPLCAEKFPEERKLPFSMKRAAIFPFNKEMHALVRYSGLLDFVIADIYDHGLSGRVGAYARKILDMEPGADLQIKNIKDIDWTCFDTLILGHLNELSELVQEPHMREFIVSEAEKHGKKVYLLDPIENKPGVYSPMISARLLPQNHFGKLYQISKPVLGIFGTSSRQGKFSLQLELRSRMQDKGYRIGQLGTEPTALLFGMDEVFPYGYNAGIELKEEEALLYLNRQMQSIATSDCEIILVGAQSAILSCEPNHVGQYTPYQTAFLQGTHPDAVVLTISPQDTKEYIERTIQYIESVIDAPVISLCLFPILMETDYLGMYSKKHRLSAEELEERRKAFEDTIGKEVYVLGNADDMNELTDKVIDFFGE